jgi:segregation and condensation protein A
LNVLENKEFVGFSELFPKNASRRILIITFLALLELIRLKQIRVTQAAVMGEIHIQKVAEPQVAMSGVSEGE